MANEQPQDEPEHFDRGDESEAIADFREPSWAFALNFFWPGAGLVYLRRPWLGLANFMAVVSIAAAAWLALPDARRESAAPWIGLILCGGSGFLAYRMANEANERLE
jgi:hypothetical protein